MQGRAREQERNRCQLTLSQLAALGVDVGDGGSSASAAPPAAAAPRVFRGLGRAYVLAPAADVAAELRSSAAVCEEEMQQLLGAKGRLEAAAAASEEALKALLSASPNLARSVLSG